jgi:arginyl-tRNA synthetase
MLSEARKQVIRALSRTDVLKDISVEELLETPPRPELGDLALPCFELARKLRKPAPSIAQEIKETIKILPPLLARVEAKAGYVNFFFDWNRIASVVLRRIERLRVEIGKGRKVMVEYVSANPIHPLHVGQLRNALLGDSLVRLLEFVGYEVLKHFYVNDLGLQAAELVYAFNLLRRKRPKEKIDHWFGKLYAIVDRYLARDKEVLGELEGKWPKAYQELIGVLEKQANPREEVQALMQRC